MERKMKEVIEAVETQIELAEKSVDYFETLEGQYQRGLTEGNRMRLESLERLLREIKGIQEED